MGVVDLGKLNLWFVPGGEFGGGDDGAIGVEAGRTVERDGDFGVERGAVAVGDLGAHGDLADQFGGQVERAQQERGRGPERAADSAFFGVDVGEFEGVFDDPDLNMVAQAGGDDDSVEGGPIEYGCAGEQVEVDPGEPEFFVGYVGPGRLG